MSAALQNEMDRLWEENNRLKSRNDALALKLETVIHTAQAFIDSADESEADDALDTHQVAVAMQPLDYEKKLDDMRAQLGAALEREQALAAHVETLKAAVEFCNEHHHFGGWSELLNSLDEQDATSLARRDLIKKAEALEDMADIYGTLGETDTKGLAAEYRQQAEALK